MNTIKATTGIIAREFGRQLQDIGLGIVKVTASDIGCDLTFMEIDNAVVIPTSGLCHQDRIALLNKAAQVGGLCRDGHQMPVRIVARGEFIHIIHGN